MGFVAWVVSHRGKLIRNSNLVRIVYYVAGPEIRRIFSPETSRNDLERALAITKDQLLRFSAMASKYNFDYKIYIIHPVQDLTGGTYTQTDAVMRAIAPHPDKLFDTAPYLLRQGNVTDLYYHFDGHLNPLGSAAISQFLINSDESKENVDG